MGCCKMSNLTVSNSTLMLGFSLVVVALIIGYVEKLRIDKDIIIGVIRAIVQLSIVGYVLKFVIKADDNCIGKKRTLHTGCGTLHCEAFFDPDTGDLLETYLSKGASGGCNQFMIGLSRMISLAARGGVDVYSIVDQLRSSGTCPSYAVRTATKHDTSKGSSCPVAVGNALLEMYTEMRGELTDDECDEVKALPVKKDNEQSCYIEKCPECGAKI